MSSSDPPLGDRFEKAVEVASERAAQKIARIHRMRLVRWTFLAAMFTTLGIILILWYAAIEPSQRQVTRNNALYTCQLITKVSGVMRQFVQSDAQLRLFQVTHNPTNQALVAGFSKIIPPKTLRTAIAKNNADTLVTVTQWRQDASKLAHLAGANCVGHIG